MFPMGRHTDLILMGLYNSLQLNLFLVRIKTYEDQDNPSCHADNLAGSRI